MNIRHMDCPFRFCRSRRIFRRHLQNIYKELHDDCGCYIPNNGYLKKMGRPGCTYCLNTVLTVRAHQANSHQGHGWEQFTDAVIHAVNAQDRPVVYMLWGSDRHRAKAFRCLTNPKHLILKSAASKSVVGIQRILRL